MKPPFNASSLFGGKIEDCPQPFVRKFPYPRRKRSVRLTVMVWCGIGHHFHTSLREESNPIWNGEAWQTSWSDPECDGKSFFEAFETEIEARKWIHYTFDKHFSRKTHKLVTDLDQKFVRWFYKEGD